MEEQQMQAASSGGGVGAIVMMIVYVAFAVLVIAMNWKIYTKAGQPGWSSIVPIYNLYVLTQIVNRPMLWFILVLLVPCVNIVILIIMAMDLYKSFGKEGWHALVPVYNLVVMYQMAFGDATYTRPERAA